MMATLGALLLIYPSIWTDMAGILALILVLSSNWRKIIERERENQVG
ncbi:hypothetical protein PD280_04190 [Virgibacillus salarius]|nr:hypothetical protein [Virgibacillus salarius]WBX80994.1 hypothetical protein PD280_04190 [Virgibacillus salarius]